MLTFLTRALLSSTVLGHSIKLVLSELKTGQSLLVVWKIVPSKNTFTNFVVVSYFRSYIAFYVNWARNCRPFNNCQIQTFTKVDLLVYTQDRRHLSLILFVSVLDLLSCFHSWVERAEMFSWNKDRPRRRGGKEEGEEGMIWPWTKKSVPFPPVFSSSSAYVREDQDRVIALLFPPYTCFS